MLLLTEGVKLSINWIWAPGEARDAIKGFNNWKFSRVIASEHYLIGFSATISSSYFHFFLLLNGRQQKVLISIKNCRKCENIAMTMALQTPAPPHEILFSKFSASMKGFPSPMAVHSVQQSSLLKRFFMSI